MVPVLALLLLIPVLGRAERPNPGVPRADLLAQGSGQRGTGPGAPGEPQRPTTRPDALLGWEWWKDDGIKKELGLTDQQVRQISRIYDDRSRQVKPFSDDYVAQLERLEQMTRAREVDTATYALQVGRVESLRSKLNETRLVMLYSFYRMLTPDQNKKLQEIRDRRRSGRGGH